MAIPGGAYKPYGYGTFFDLDPGPNAPIRSARGVMIGRRALVDLWKRQQDDGMSHVTLNLKMSRRPTSELVDELGNHVLPHFDIG